MDRIARALKTFLLIAVPYFRSEDRWRARALLSGIIAVELSIVYLAVLVNEWNRVFYNALQDRDWTAFLWSLVIFAGLTAAAVGLAVLQYWLAQVLVIRWRRWMTARYLARWLNDGRLYRMQFVGKDVDNIHLRIANDVHLFIQDTLDLGTGILGSLVTIASFAVILWGLSIETPLSAFGVTIAIPGYLVWVALIYASLGTLITHLIGHSLIDLNFKQQRREADFRFAIARVSDHAEPIAVMGGQEVERADLSHRFAELVANWKNVVARQARLSAFVTSYAQVSTVFPVLVASPAYFMGVFSLGALMQAALAFQRVETALAYFIGAYSKLAEWKALVDRLAQFEVALEAVETAPAEAASIKIEPAPENLVEISDLVLCHPDGERITTVPALSLKPGDHLLVTGSSGSGKSMLVRALRGLWPFGRGRIRAPDDAQVMAIPQRSYFPLGTLKAALAYPVPAETVDDDAARAAMEVVGLGHLAERLHEEADWRTELSGGEQQRAALAGVLLRPPRLLLLDEPVSSLDEASGRELIGRLIERLPNTIFVSIGRRSVLGPHHERTIELKKATRRPSSRSRRADMATASAS